MPSTDSRAQLSALRKLYFRLEKFCELEFDKKERLPFILFAESARRVQLHGEIQQKTGIEQATRLQDLLESSLPKAIYCFPKIEFNKSEKLFNSLTKELNKNAELLNAFDERFAGYFYQFSKEDDRQLALKRIQSANKQTSNEDIIAFTQLYTPDWSADFLIANTVLPQFQNSLPVNNLIKQNSATQAIALKSAEQITLLDPACGAGHILLRAFDLFLQMYESEGVEPSIAARKILEFNLYACDIDIEALRICALSLLLKAAVNSNADTKLKLNLAPLSPEAPTSKRAHAMRPYIRTEAYIAPDGSEAEFGSLLREWPQDHILASKYDVVVANPPYIGRRLMDRRLKQFLKQEFPSAEHDISAAFLLRSLELCKTGGKVAFITQSSLLYLPSYENLRKRFIEDKLVTSVVELGTGVFPLASGEKINSMLIVLQKDSPAQNSEISFLDLSNSKSKDKDLHTNIDTALIQRKATDFLAFRACAFNYKYPAILASILADNRPLEDLAEVKQGLATTDNNRFIRYHWDVKQTEIGTRWKPYIKGAGSERWYAACQTVLDWGTNGQKIKEAVELSYPYLKGKVAWVVKNEQYYFKPGLTFSFVSTGNFAVRRMIAGCIFDVAGSALFCKSEDESAILAYLNSSFAALCAQTLNPTVNFQVGDIKQIPFVSFSDQQKSCLTDLANEAFLLKERICNFDETHIAFQPDRRIIALFNSRTDAETLWKEIREEIDSIALRLDAIEKEIDTVILNSLKLSHELSQSELLELESLLHSKQLSRKETKIPFASSKEFAEQLIRIFLIEQSDIIPTCKISSPFADDLGAALIGWLEAQLMMPLSQYFTSSFNKDMENIFHRCPPMLALCHNGEFIFLRTQVLRNTENQLPSLQFAGTDIKTLAAQLAKIPNWTGKDFSQAIMTEGVQSAIADGVGH